MTKGRVRKYLVARVLRIDVGQRDITRGIYVRGQVIGGTAGTVGRLVSTLIDKPEDIERLRAALAEYDSQKGR